MSSRQTDDDDAALASRAWVARIVVWSAFVAVLWTLGPRAYAVLMGRVEAAPRGGPAVDLDRVGIADRPDWVTDNLLVAIARDLQPWLNGPLPVLDEAPARELLTALQQVPWVVDAHLERVYPDRFRIRFGLRRPVVAVRDERGRPLCLADRHAILLPWVDHVPVPDVVLRRDGEQSGSMAGSLGEVAPDRRVRAAVDIALEWRDQLAPLVPDTPDLVEIDTTNLGYRWVHGIDYPEVRILLRGQDGARIAFGYGRPVDSRKPRVSVETKAFVLRGILAEKPGLAGLVAGDLRFRNRWRAWLQPR